MRLPHIKKVLVTGATGFIGSSLIKRLSQCQVKVLALARDASQISMKGSKNIEVIQCDLLNPRQVSKTVPIIKGCDCIVHLASLIPESAGSNDQNVPQDFFENLLMAFNALRLVHSKIKVFIYTSTLDVYGNPEYLPVNESHPAEPVTFYGASKLAAEKYLKVYLKKSGIPLSILRLSSVYGPNDNLIKAIPSFINRIKQGKPPIIYGTGSDMRDYIYIDDAVTAIINSIEARADGVFNIAAGKSCSVKEVCLMLLRISRKKLKPVYMPRRKKLINFHFDISLAEKKLSFRPSVDINEGLRMAYFRTLNGR